MRDEGIYYKAYAQVPQINIASDLNASISYFQMRNYLPCLTESE